MTKATRLRVEVLGLEDLLAKLERIGVRVQDVLEPAALAASGLVRDVAMSGAPGPHVEMRVTRRAARRVEVSIGPDREHWYYRFAESGTRRHGPTGKRTVMVWRDGEGLIVARSVAGVPAKPFLKRALKDNEGAASDEMGATLRSAVERVA